MIGDSTCMVWKQPKRTRHKPVVFSVADPIFRALCFRLKSCRFSKIFRHSISLFSPLQSMHLNTEVIIVIVVVSQWVCSVFLFYLIVQFSLFPCLVDEKMKGNLTFESEKFRFQSFYFPQIFLILSLVYKKIQEKHKFGKMHFKWVCSFFFYFLCSVDEKILHTNFWSLRILPSNGFVDFFFPVFTLQMVWLMRKRSKTLNF